MIKQTSYNARNSFSICPVKAKAYGSITRHAPKFLINLASIYAYCKELTLKNVFTNIISITNTEIGCKF